MYINGLNESSDFLNLNNTLEWIYESSCNGLVTGTDPEGEGGGGKGAPGPKKKKGK